MTLIIGQLAGMPPYPYKAVSPDGTEISLTKELWEALVDMKQRQHSGSIVISFNSGRIAGVEMAVKKVYK
jgi:hypothetical protein